MLFCICYILLFSFSVKSDSPPPNYCLPIQPITQNPQLQSIPEASQGRPGRIGPAGPPGSSGAPGPPGIRGECACDPNEVDQLRTEIQRTNEIRCGVGIKDGRIPNSAINASSYHSNGYQGHYGRLDNTGDPRGFWHPRIYSGAWLQVDLGRRTRVTGVITQGRPTLDQWTTSYKIRYGNLPSSLSTLKLSGVDVVFQGNRDRNSKVTNFFRFPVTARYFRIVAVTYEVVPVLRIEYLTC